MSTTGPIPISRTRKDERGKDSGSVGVDHGKGVVSHLEKEKERKEHRMGTYKGIPAERSKKYMEKRGEEFFDLLRERKQKSIDFWKNAIRDSPDMEKVKKKKVVAIPSSVTTVPIL